jgi:hypothetical protein
LTAFREAKGGLSQNSGLLRPIPMADFMPSTHHLYLFDRHCFAISPKSANFVSGMPVRAMCMPLPS